LKIVAPVRLWVIGSIVNSNLVVSAASDLFFLSYQEHKHDIYYTYSEIPWQEF
jgi:hypothetical protein